MKEGSNLSHNNHDSLITQNELNQPETQLGDDMLVGLLIKTVSCWDDDQSYV